jgi:hypothetical protein
MNFSFIAQVVVVREDQVQFFHFVELKLCTESLSDAPMVTEMVVVRTKKKPQVSRHRSSLLAFV